MTMLGIFGLIFMYGSVGAYECDTIDTRRFIVQSAIGIGCMLLAMLFSKHQYHIDFVRPNGQHKKVRANTRMAKLVALAKYNMMGYKLHTEREVA